MRSERPRALTTTPTVSVVIPCYNYAHFLPAAVASVLDQQGVRADVLIVDDASSDASPEVARRLAAADPRVRVVLHEQNMGHIATYNDGLSRVTGDYVVLLSADDLLMPGSLARSTALLEAEPDVVLAYGYPVTFVDEPPADDGAVRGWTVWDGEEWLHRVCARGRNVIANPEVVLRRSVMDELGGYEADHPHAADLKLWMRAAARGGVGRVNGPVQACYRQHGDNMHTTHFAGMLTDLREVKRVFDTFFDEGEVTAPVAARLRPAANRALAREALMLAGVAQAEGGRRTGASADELAGFAAACYPAVVGSRGWRAVERRRRTGVGAVERTLVRRAFAVRWAVRWRRWRRWGT